MKNILKTAVLSLALSAACAAPALAASVQPITCNITASQTTINRGQSITLNWSSTNGTKQTLSLGSLGGNVPVAASGSMTVTPRGSMPFFLNVTEVIPHVGGTFLQCGVQITVNQ